MTRAAVHSPDMGSRSAWSVRSISIQKLGGPLIAIIFLGCFLTLPWSVQHYDQQNLDAVYQPPSAQYLLGTDALGRSVLWRCLLGGAISLSIGLAAATLAVGIGTAWGMCSGYFGGRLDSFMMRFVDVMYCLPYILLVVLLSVALQPLMVDLLSADQSGGSAASEPDAVLLSPASIANVLTLLIAISAVSWLTMARVIRGQVLSMRSQAFMEAGRALGLPTWRLMLRHMLPNLIGPIVVYATLAVPQAILQESFLSFLGIGIRPPLPSWGTMASDGLAHINLIQPRYWLILWPCLLLGLTLLALNFLGDSLRDRYDPHTQRSA